MSNIEELFKQICLEEAKHLNEFWETSIQRLSVLESEIADEKIKEKNRQMIYCKRCEEIEDVLARDGYSGTAEEVIEYFSRRNSNLYVNNCYFEVQSKLEKLYNLLPLTKSEKLELLQFEYEDIKFKMHKFKHINEDILYYTILKAFQEIIPERSLDLGWGYLGILSLGYQIEFPHSIEVEDKFVDYQLVDWYIRNINNYLCTPMQGLRMHERERLFK